MYLQYETPRLTLKILNDSHYMQVLDFLQRNQKLFELFEAPKHELFYTPEYQRNSLIQEFNQILKGYSVRFFVYRKENEQEIIGTVSFSNFRRGAFQSCELGYKFDSNYHHKGFAYEAITNAINIVIPEYHFHRVEAHILPFNFPSIRLIENLGFQLEGTAYSYAHVNGQRRDHLQYSYIFS